MFFLGKYYWHVSRLGGKPTEIRHYNHITKMYKFILRNPAMFKDKTLTIYDDAKAVTNMTFNEIKYRASLNLCETVERRYVLSLTQRLKEEQKEARK
ncbi:hypothetical protein D3B61_05135 [Listeria monocytogenes]|uniref:hypothetical protein n=1 Tax=Listeria monocytogenes TaxID=1639 RepID=UPI000E6D5771|nr:hypothetical protein [Listeria monocytogenes]NVX79360.1 hypothetical protein [Listeria monocytogenes]NVX81413.1 hypothetical protein [Listeria monocytogenes]RJC21239.1 hypothetical protein D3B66_05135 [Listeria monocytogenes]RJC26110.1 hypothetical protein D3B64_05135 [Listeria monocytogenes]RJC34988.1 hypothetical protein D3B61_05135 [Listeria monocytogenes]